MTLVLPDQPASIAPPAAIVAAARAAGLPADEGRWLPLQGGRTNRLWRFGPDAAPLVCKLYAPHAATPLFPNDAEAEWRAVSALVGTGLAPEPVARLTAPPGECLIYGLVRTNGTAPNINAVARLFRRLHDTPPPAGLRRLPATPAALCQQADEIVATLPGPDRAWTWRLRPVEPATDFGPPVFVHGDAVSGNVLATAKGPRLIDWQCPGVGDATEDIAAFLSPGMRRIYGAAPIARTDAAAFLAAYGDPAVAARYQALAPLYHYRMAAHCLWRAARGDAGYADAAELEAAALTRGVP